MQVFLKIYAILALTAAAAIHNVKAKKYLETKPDFLTPCTLPDHNFKKCYAKNFEGIYTVWKDGIPGLKEAGTFDPLYVTRVTIAQDSNNALAFGQMEMTNLVITGIRNMKVQEANFNPKTLKAKFKTFVPKLRFEGDYKLKGSIFNLPLNGHGKCLFEIENFIMNVLMQLKLRDEHGYTFTDIEKLRLSVDEVGGFHVNLANLFNGQKTLEDSTNAIFNENWRDIYAILREPITEAYEIIITDRLSKAFSFVPGNFFISDLPTAAQHSG